MKLWITRHGQTDLNKNQIMQGLVNEPLNETGIADFSDFKRHMDHFLELGGFHHLSIGGDLDGCDQLPTGFAGVESWNDLGRWLQQQGVEEETVNNVFNNNAVLFALKHLQKSRVGG